jgi:thiol-disulfide isomerase/thioredoxin
VSVGLWILIAAVVGAFAFGGWRLARDGRFRGTHVVSDKPDRRPQIVDESLLGAVGALGEKATLVQFSSAFCAPCRTTRHVLAGVAADVDGVRHVEIDAEHHLELVRTLGIMRTPTTLVLGPQGEERFRAAGVPTAQRVLAVLG